MPPPPAPALSAPAGTSNAPDSVGIVNFAFSPATLTVPVGTTVTWTNRDQDAHNVVDRAGTFRSPTLNPGDTYRYTFNQPGQYSYLCTIHPFMTATVVVTR
jgi:plastocyanin